MAKERKYLVAFWVLTLLVIAAIFFSIIDVAPFLHGDEFIILDLGRVIINPESDWSINWIIDRNEPALVFFYVGPVIDELIYLLFGEYGPRVAGIVGALFAATVLLGWLVSRRTPKNIAFCIGLIFLLDPIFVHSYTLGRLDGWSIGFSLLSCWLLRSTRNNIISSRSTIQQHNWIILAGIFSIAAIFIWPSSFILFPLIISELLNVPRKINFSKSSKKKMKYSIFFVFTISCFLSTIMFSIPLLFFYPNSLINIIEGLLINLSSTPSTTGETVMASSRTKFIELLRILKFTPVLVFLSLTSLFIKRDKLLIGGTLSAFLIIFFTVVYIKRVQYMLPYFCAMSSTVFSLKPIFKNRFEEILTRFKNWSLLLMLTWAFSISLITRTILAYYTMESYSNRDLVLEMAEEMIGVGTYKVFLSPMEFYLSGRSLGWEMYGQYRQLGEGLTPETLHPILPKLDYIILKEWEVTEEFDDTLSLQGFSQRKTFSLYQRPQVEWNGKTTNIQRLRNLFSITENPYGNYKLYYRKSLPRSQIVKNEK